MFFKKGIKRILTGGLFFIILELNAGTVLPEKDSPKTIKYCIRFDIRFWIIYSYHRMDLVDILEILT